MNPSTILIGGYANFPGGATAKEFYGILGISFEVDPESGEIMDVDSTYLTILTREFVRSLLIGHNMKDTIEKPIQLIEQRYFGRNKKALIAAVTDAFRVYEKYLSDRYSM